MLRLDNGVAVFQSTLSMRRATQKPRSIICHYTFQSTLSMRRATGMAGVYGHTEKFQSTLSMRRATWPPSWQSRKARYFNPRSP